jgi:hypothetical protein
MDNISEDGMAAMLICISSPYGFSCELVQQAITLKTKIGSRYSGPLYLEKDNSCKSFKTRFSQSFVALEIMDEVELLESPLEDHDPFTCNIGLLEVDAKCSSFVRFLQRGLQRQI